MRGRNVISIADLTASDIERVLATALALKDAGRRPLLADLTLALVFEKPSLRTRASFEVAMRHLGGDCIYLSPPEVGLPACLKPPQPDSTGIFLLFQKQVTAAF